MTHKQLNIYWVLTILIGPIIYALFFDLRNSQSDAIPIFPSIVFIFVYSIILSIPTLLINHFSIFLYKKYKANKLKTGLPIFILTSVLLTLTFHLIGIDVIKNPISHIYYISNILAFLIISLTKLITRKKLPTTQV